MTEKTYTSDEFHSLLRKKLDESAESFGLRLRASNQNKKAHNPFTNV